MSSYGSWSVKGIDDRARAVAKEEARREGVTLGDYINGLLLKGHSEAGPRDLPDADVPTGDAPQSPDTEALNTIARRIEAVEARSTLAITGIDQSVLGLLARIENTDNASSAMAAEVEAMIDELRETQEHIQKRIIDIEHDDTAAQNLESMKALEQALGKLASHVYEESSLNQDETNAIKGRMESGFADLTDRVDGMETKVETTLSDAAKRVEDAVLQAELRAEGTSRHLSERFTAIESGVATKLAKVEDVDARMKAVETDVSSAITSMEGTMVRIQERLNRAETTTDTALKALEQTFASLDDRIEQVAAHANPERAEALRNEFEKRFDSLAKELRASIEATRAQLANEIEQAAAGENPELMGRIETTIDTLKQRLTTGEERSSRALEAVSAQVNRIATGLDTRIRKVEAQDTGAVVEAVRSEVSKTTEALESRLDAVETREDRLVDEITSQMGALADQLDTRVTESESRSAAAIEQVGEQVASAIKRVQARQETIATDAEGRITALSKQQDARLSKALSGISERLSKMQSQTVSVVSPVQKAIASLAARIEEIEDFNAPPHSTRMDRGLPDMPEMEADAGEDFVSFTDTVAETPTETLSDVDEDFVPGLPVQDDFTDTQSVGDDWRTAANQGDEDDTSEHNYRADIPGEPEDDPLLDLTAQPFVEDGEDFETWDDGRDEARDNDVFSDADAFGEDFELAGNVPQLALDTVDDTPLPEPALQVDQDATDYLARARRAAIAAAEENNTKKKTKGRRSAASASPRKPRKTKAKVSGDAKGSSKLPIIATASVIALAAAGAGGYIALRGTQDTPKMGVATTTTLGLNSSSEAATPNGEATLSGIEFVEGQDADGNAIEAELFDDEGSAALADPALATAITEPVPDITTKPSPAANLPTVPKRLTLERAAQEGTPIAQYQWAEARLAAKDYVAGPDFVRRAAQQGLPAAQYRLAKLHEQGLGVPRDMTEARQWTEKAARGGNVKAMHDLAVFFADGEGGPQSYAGAVEWFRKAADFGVVDSQYNLAVLYENGLGISRSLPDALYWYEIAALNGDASAPGNVASLREQLTLEQAQTAQRRAASWAAATPAPASNGKFAGQPWQNGSREQVRAVQTVLNGLGYDAGTPDGLAGAGTRTALRAFQSDQGLTPDGQITDAVVDALNEAATDARG